MIWLRTASTLLAATTGIFAGWMILLQASIPAHASPAPSTPPGLSEPARMALRSRLEKIFYEQDMLVRNHTSDLSNLKRQQLEFDTLKVFVRIPFREDLPGLTTSLRESARDHKLKLISFKRLPKIRARAPAVPSTITTDRNPPFKLAEGQLVEKIPFKATVEGDRSAVTAWIRSWPEDQMRLAEPESPDLESSIRPARSKGPKNEARWEVRARAFRFREVKFPSLEPRDPLEILPAWARKQPELFAEKEPALWQFVQKTQAISPRARPLFRTREQVLLNSARMSFFLSKATRPGGGRHGH